MQLVAVTDALGRRWEYRYDEAGRLVGESDFQGRRTSYELDPAGRPVAATNALGEQIRYTYDALGRTVAKDAAGLVTRYDFDPAGRLVRAVGPDAELTRTVDALGNLLTETVNGRTTSHTRDALGRRTRRVTPAGHTSTWTYDTAGRPSSLTVPGGGLAFRHDALGRELERTLGPGLTLDRSWDPRHRLGSQTLLSTRPGRPAVLQQHDYRYRADGNLVGVDDLLAGPRTFELDPAGRVTGVDAATGAERYAYDPAGNLTAAQWPATPATGAAVGERSYRGTELTAAGRIRYEYDAAGRTVLRQKTRLSKKPDTWHYSWDAEGRLTGVVTPDGTRWRYRYDPLGRRIAKQRLGADGTGVAEQIDFSWDGALLAEQTTSAPYLPGPHTLSWDYQGLHPLAQSETITTLGPDAPQEQVDRRFFAVVTDLIGTPTELVDPVTDTVAWRAVPTLWGNTTWPADSTTYTPLRFPGQYFDPETRLHYNLNRYYDPETARYTSPDPLGLVPAPNPDAYVGNPHTWCDPLGLSPHSRRALPPALREPPNAPGSPITSRLGRPGETFNMVISRGQSVSRPGGFGTFDDVPNQEFVRRQLAIRTDWKSDVSLVQRYAFPAHGEPIRIQESVIGPQDDPLLGHLPGGATQLEILKFEDRARLIPVGDPVEIS
nr:RHS repeat-associated core domain-containing protein [Kitasatospora cheerisanensis]